MKTILNMADKATNWFFHTKDKTLQIVSEDKISQLVVDMSVKEKEGEEEGGGRRGRVRQEGTEGRWNI